MIPLLKHGHHYKITIQKRGYRLTNWDFVMNHIGSSQILPNGRGYTLEALRPKLETNKIKTLTLVCNKMNHMRNNPDKFIAQLVKSKTKKRELKYTNKNDLLLIWSKITSMKNINEKRIALQKINRTILHNFNTSPLSMHNFPFLQIFRPLQNKKTLLHSHYRKLPPGYSTKVYNIFPKTYVA